MGLRSHFIYLMNVFKFIDGLFDFFIVISVLWHRGKAECLVF